MQTEPPGQTDTIRRHVLGLLAALPLVLMQVLYCSDVGGWSYVLAMALFPLIPIAFVGWLGAAFAETRFRSRFPKASHWPPWFALVGLFFLFAFPLFGKWLRPVVKRYPEWCRVSQTVTWKTSRLEVSPRGNHSFILVLNGPGNVSQFRLQSGWLNWTGDEQAGLPRFDLTKESYHHWEGYKEIEVPLSSSALRARMAAANLPEGELDLLASEIWRCLELVKEGKPLADLAAASIGEVYDGPSHYEDEKLGGLVWTSLLLVAFQCVGRWSMPASYPSKESEPRNRAP